MNKSPVIFGIGNPLIDIVILVNDNDIISLGLNKGTMELVELKEQKEILQYFKDSKLKFCPGGSAPNTIIACAGLGISSMLSGKIGADKFGDIIYLFFFLFVHLQHSLCYQKSTKDIYRS